MTQGPRLVPGRDGARRPRLFYWSETTASVAFETGIQRVVRRLGQALSAGGFEVVPIGWDDRRRLPRPLAPELRETLGLASLVKDDAFPHRSPGDWFVIPEVTISFVQAEIDVAAIGRAYGLPVAAVVHDLIPLKLAEHYEPGTVALYRGYFRMIADVDLVVVTTRHVAEDLHRYLRSQDLTVPEIVVCPLPAELPGTSRRLRKPAIPAPGAPLELLAVSTWEPRKNLARLLRAAARLDGRRLELTLVGRRGAFPDYDAEVEALAGGMANVRLVERLPDTDLATLFDACHASVYPSWEEGFGLPILESLWLATPCLCHCASSMAEVAPGGGTMMLDMLDEAAIAGALDRLSRDPALLERLTAEAIARPLATWAEFGSSVARHLLPSAG